MEEDAADQVEQATESSVAVEAGRTVKVKTVRIAREAQRQVDAALREAQREVAQAQREVARAQRDAQREQIREQTRIASGGRGRGGGQGGGGGEGERFTSQESKTFPVSGSPRVDLGTFDRYITVPDWDKGEGMDTWAKHAGEDD